MIINNQQSDEAGQHWIALYFDEKQSGIFFDSYGNSAKFYNLDNYIKKHSKSFIENTVQLQSITSVYCGIYCVLFLIFMSNNYSLSEFIKLFKIRNQNEKMIEKFLKIF